MKDIERVKRCLAHVDAFKVSGQKAQVWASANDVRVNDLLGWCGYASRWRAALAGEPHKPKGTAAQTGFVRAQLKDQERPQAQQKKLGGVANDVACGQVRIELRGQGYEMVLHWPAGRPGELASFARELGR